MVARKQEEEERQFDTVKSDAAEPVKKNFQQVMQGEELVLLCSLLRSNPEFECTATLKAAQLEEDCQ